MADRFMTMSFALGAAGLVWAGSVGCAETRPVVLPADFTAEPIAVLRVTACERGDLCTVLLRPESGFGSRPVPVRLRGIDAPRAESPCVEERRAADEARRAVEARLLRGRTVTLTDVSHDLPSPLTGRLVVDGEDLASLLLERGLAVLHDGGPRREWCE